MKVLLVGGGGREHALAWKFVREQPDLELIAAPGNPGIAALGECVPIAATDLKGLVRLALERRPDLVVVGPEAPLAAGIVDVFREQSIPIFGPTKAAAQLESSKAFAKRIMEDAGVPTASATGCSRAQDAHRAVASTGAPVVIKASGLAAGKGVFVCLDEAEAHAAVDLLMQGGGFGGSGSTVLVEEFMEGEEISLFALTDGTAVLPMIPVQDHKRLLDGDLGPNTGGMGAYAPVSVGGASLMVTAMKTVFQPTLAAMRQHGHPFSGLLYAGLMLTSRGLKVVEFNCRFGDPETQALMPLLRSPILPQMFDIATHGSLAGAAPFEWEHAASVATVVAAPSYPDAPSSGARIDIPVLPQGVEVFHSGTAFDGDGATVTSGGRILTVTAIAPSFAAAQQLSRESAEAVRFEGARFRRDIGWREVARSAGAS